MDKNSFGRYEIKSKLGQGGMGSVFYAWDPNFQRDVALKLLDRRFSHKKNFRRRFEREARAVARIDHPRIVPIYDYGEDEGHMFLVMPLMEGGTLKQKLAHGPLSIDEAANIIQQIAPALTTTHQLGMVHRDLKPDNILFDHYDNAFVSDFGIVKLVEAETNLTAGGFIGTPAYMSPEQVIGKQELDGRSDIYALGVILFEMLTGTRPYEADAPLPMALKHVTEPVPSILAVNPDLPVGCELIISRAMQKEPADRYQTIDDLVTDLENIDQLSPFDEENPRLPSDGLTQDLPEIEPDPAAPKRRWPLFLALVVALLLIGGGLTGGWWIITNNQPTPTANRVAIAPPPTPTDTPTPTPTAVPSQTPTVTPSQTPIPPPPTTSANITTVPPTDTPIPTIPPTPTPVLVRQVINRQNLPDLSQWLSIPGSTAVLHHVALSPDEQWTAVASDQGVQLYQLPDLTPDRQVIEGEVTQIAWSPDGRQLATSGPEGNIRLWDTSDWSETAVTPGAATALAWSPDGQWLLWGTAGGAVTLWNPAAAEPAATWTDHTSAITALAWNPASTRFGSASQDSNFHIRNLTDANPIRSPFRQNGVWSLAWSPDGSQIATAGGDGVVRLEDAASGGATRSLNCSGGQPRSLVWLDGATLATGSDDGRVRICPISDRNPSQIMGNHGGVQQLFWLPGSQQLLSLGSRDGSLQLWSAADGSRISASFDYTGYSLATTVQWSPDGTSLAIGTEEGIVLIWDLAEAQIRAVFGGHEAEILSLAWSPDGRYLATSGFQDTAVRVTDVQTGNLVQTVSVHDDQVTAVSWGSDSTQLASAGYDGLKIWHLQAEELVGSWSMEALGREKTAAWSPDGNEIVTGGQTSLVQLRPPQSNRLTVTLTEHNAPVRAAAWAHDSQRFATGDNNGRLLVWQTAVADDGLPLLTMELGTPVRYLTWSPDDAILTALTAATARFQDADSGEQITTLGNLHSFSGTLAWSPDGRLLAGVRADGVVQLWHVLAEAAP